MGKVERTIEVTIISATDLKKVKKFGREQKNYVSAYIYPGRTQTTGADPYGGVNPTWNSTLKLACYESDLYPAATSSEAPAASSSSGHSAHEMTVAIYSVGGGVFHSADKLVGTVTVPLKQVASAAKAGGTLPSFGVHLPTDSGEVQGSLNLSVKLGAKRELGEYEDLTAAPVPFYSDHSDQGAPSFTYPQASGKGPSMQTSSYNAQGQSSYGKNPPTNDNHASDKVPSMQSGSYNPQGQSSYGMNPPTSDYYTQSAPNQNTVAAEEVVTGYPAQGGYAFAPLGQLPLQGQEQRGPGTSHGPYVVHSSGGITHYQTRRERRARKGVRRGREGPVRGLGRRVGMMLVQSLAGAMQHHTDGPSSSSSQCRKP